MCQPHRTGSTSGPVPVMAMCSGRACTSRVRERRWGAVAEQCGVQCTTRADVERSSVSSQLFRASIGPFGEE